MTNSTKLAIAILAALVLLALLGTLEVEVRCTHDH